MGALSISLTLAKSSAPNGASIAHNNREFFTKNVEQSRSMNNIIYISQPVEAAYDELFGAALAEYNAKQTRADRKIDDYFKHIDKGKREESFYEVVVQFGDSYNAGVGSENGELVAKMLDEYMRNFKSRNPNLHIFNSSLHLDETSPHIHIDFIPFYTKLRKNGLSKGVSMRAALDEQGFGNQNKKSNSLVLWEESEVKAMEKILNRHGFSREIKNSDHVHQTVEGYKELQDEKKIVAAQVWQTTEPTLLQQENNILKHKNEKLTSPLMSFFYSVPEKQSFVQANLAKRGIPFRETENGFEAQECYTEQIRTLEKEYRPKSTSYREELRDQLDRFIILSKSYDEVMSRLRNADYEIKQGKYVAVKPKSGKEFIRLKSLGEDYSEQAIRNRIVSNARFISDVDSKIAAAKNHTGNGHSDTLDVMANKTIKHYTVVFVQGVLPVRKRNKRKPFSWTNDAELDRLLDLNKKINSGATLQSLRNDFAAFERDLAENENKIITLKNELHFFNKLYERGVRVYEKGQTTAEDLTKLAENKITVGNYKRIMELVAANETEIATLELSVSDERVKLKDTADTLTAFEKISGGTYVQSLIEAERGRRQAEYIKNGTKRAE